MVIRLEHGPLDAVVDAALDVDGGAPYRHIAPFRVGLGGERAGTPDHGAVAGQFAQAVDAFRVQLVLVAVLDAVFQAGHAAHRGFHPGGRFPDAARAVGARPDAGGEGRGRDSQCGGHVGVAVAVVEGVGHLHPGVIERGVGGGGQVQRGHGGGLIEFQARRRIDQQHAAAHRFAVGNGSVNGGIAGAVRRHGLAGQQDDVDVAHFLQLGEEAGVVVDTGWIAIVTTAERRHGRHHFRHHVLGPVDFRAARAFSQFQQGGQRAGAHHHRGRRAVAAGGEGEGVAGESTGEGRIGIAQRLYPRLDFRRHLAAAVKRDAGCGPQGDGLGAEVVNVESEGHARLHIGPGQSGQVATDAGGVLVVGGGRSFELVGECHLDVLRTAVDHGEDIVGVGGVHRQIAEGFQGGPDFITVFVFLTVPVTHFQREAIAVVGGHLRAQLVARFTRAAGRDSQHVDLIRTAAGAAGYHAGRQMGNFGILCQAGDVGIAAAVQEEVEGGQAHGIGRGMNLAESGLEFVPAMHQGGYPDGACRGVADQRGHRGGHAFDGFGAAGNLFDVDAGVQVAGHILISLLVFGRLPVMDHHPPTARPAFKGSFLHFLFRRGMSRMWVTSLLQPRRSLMPR